MKNDELAKYVKLATYTSIGESISKSAKYGMALSTLETIEALDFINFARLHDFRIRAYNKITDADHERNIQFNSFDDERKEIRFKLDKGAERIDFKGIEKAGVTVTDLLEIIYLNPEVNAMFQKYIDEPEKYVFSQANIDIKGKSGIGYYSNDKSRSFEISCLAKADKDGKLLQIGNKGRVLAQLLFEWGKYLKIAGYCTTKPTNKDEKAFYEVELMSTYYRRVE